jgi:hypothetical protein
MIHRPTPYYENKDIHITVEVEPQKYCPEHTPAVSLYPMDFVWLMLVFWAFIAILIIHFNLKDSE